MKQLNQVGQWVVKQRKSRGMTQLDLSETLGISPRTLSKIENGFDMRLSLLLEIADAVGGDASELITQRPRPGLTAQHVQEIEHHLSAIKQLLYA